MEEKEYYDKKYETHCHTREASACATAAGEKQAEFYKARGFTGMIVTDHFVNGNTTAPREASWEEKINILCSGYEAAKKRGDEIGIDVFFGWEYGYKGMDLLTYGFDKEWLLSHPEITDMSVKEYCDFVHSEGGLIVHAHPFREDWYIDMIRLVPRECDGCEVINSCRKDLENSMASFYADMYGLRRTAGSDNHHAKQSRLSGISTHERIQSIEDFTRIIRSNRYRIFDEKEPEESAAALSPAAGSIV